MGWEWIVMPMLGALIGWITNFLAIRMLFRPRHPIKLGWFKIQGLIPRRRDDLAESVAQTVEKDLLPVDELLGKMDVQRYEREVVEAVVHYVDGRLDNQLVNALPGQLRNVVSGYVRRVVEREAKTIVKDLSARLTKRIQDDFSIGELIKDKMDRLDLDELENLVQRVARKELSLIEWLGGILGFGIGLIQAAFVTLTR